jgi:hypothetical protein
VTAADYAHLESPFGRTSFIGAGKGSAIAGKVSGAQLTCSVYSGYRSWHFVSTILRYWPPSGSLVEMRRDV